MSAQVATFGQNSDAYKAARPAYPEALFEWLASVCGTAARDDLNAWDCGTGNGQSALGLARHFAHVDATDVSAEQIAVAAAHPRIAYKVCAAEASGLAGATYDLVAVAQALHWFDFDRFWPEVRRVTKPGAFFAAWGYAWMHSDADVERGLLEPWLTVVERYWAPQNKTLWDSYPVTRTKFPFARVSTPQFAISQALKAEEIVAYLETWSASKIARERGQGGQLDEVQQDALARFKDRRFRTHMPLAVLAGYVDHV